MATDTDHNVIYVCVSDKDPMPEISVSRPFAAVVVVEAKVSHEFRREASRWLVDNGCMYMMAWGPDCSLWDDSVDIANLEDFDFGDVPDASFVMTTWHERETLDQVMWFCKNNATVYSDVEFRSVLLLHICDTANETNMLKSYQAA